MKTRFLYINYVGKVKASGEVFDTNLEEIAKKEGIYDEKRKYKPLAVITGSNRLFRALEEEISKMDVGEKKIITLPPEKAFGLRDEKLKRVFSLKDFEKEPQVGQKVFLRGLEGRIISISGGRVIVDFNHPLAGKELEFEIEVVKEAKDLKEKVLVVLDSFTNSSESFEVLVKNEKVEIKDLKNILTPSLRISIKDAIFKFLKNLKEVIFINQFSAS